MIANWRPNVLTLPSGQLKPVNVMHNKIADVAANVLAENALHPNWVFMGELSLDNACSIGYFLCSNGEHLNHVK